MELMELLEGRRTYRRFYQMCIRDRYFTTPVILASRSFDALTCFSVYSFLPAMSLNPPRKNPMSSPQESALQIT